MESAWRQHLSEYFRKYLWLATLLLLYNDALGGFLRFASASVGLLAASYAPMGLSVVIVTGYLLFSFASLKMPKHLAGFVLFTLFFVAYSFALGAPANRIFFAVYTWIPFFVGVLIYDDPKQMDRVWRHVPYLWATLAFGVILNKFVSFPWTGFTYEVMGMEMQATREWNTLGIDRLAGFTRASFIAGNDLVVYASLLLLSPRLKKAAKLAMWLVSVWAIALTTSKTPLIAMFIVPLVLAVCGTAKEERKLALASVWGLTTVMVGLPLLPDLNTLFSQDFELGFIQFASLLDRMNMMWPGAFELLYREGTSIVWLLGRGFGGIGVGQTLTEPFFVNTADNMFLFLYVTFGLGAAYFGWRMMKNLGSALDDDTFKRILAISISVIVIGFGANNIECASLALFFGMMCSYLPARSDA